jgi:transcription initiation factor TFIIB
MFTSLSVNRSDFVERSGCSNCLSTKVIFDPESAERICAVCCVVLGAEQIDGLGLSTNIRGTELNIHSGLPSSLAHHDRRLSTLISYSKVDANGVSFSASQRSKIHRMRKWNEISNYNRSYHRNLKNAFAILVRIKDKLSLSQTVVERAAYYYRKVVDLHIIKGRSIKGFIVSCVYVACREMNIPRSINEIAEISGCDKRFAGKCFRLLLKTVNIALPVVNSGSHLARIANNAGVSEKTLRKAIQMMAIIKENPLSYGKDPNALAAAVIYGACLAHREKTTRTQIATAANTSLVTLRNRFLDLKKVLPNLPSGPKDDSL